MKTYDSNYEIDEGLTEMKDQNDTMEEQISKNLNKIEEFTRQINYELEEIRDNSLFDTKIDKENLPDKMKLMNDLSNQVEIFLIDNESHEESESRDIIDDLFSHYHKKIDDRTKNFILNFLLLDDYIEEHGTLEID